MFVADVELEWRALLQKFLDCRLAAVLVLLVGGDDVCHLSFSRTVHAVKTTFADFDFPE